MQGSLFLQLVQMGSVALVLADVVGDGWGQGEHCYLFTGAVMDGGGARDVPPGG